MPQEKPYKSPRAPLGLVKWSPGLNQKWYPAIVTKNSGEAIEVMVFPAESRAPLVRDSVRHETDPVFTKLLDQKGGVWDYTDEHKLLAGLAQLVLPDSQGFHTAMTPELAKLRPLIEGLVYTPGPVEPRGSDPGDDPDNAGY